MVQGGENNGDAFFGRLYNLLTHAKNEYPDLVFMCSFGNLSEDKYRRLKEIGIERYLLKFETSDSRLYAQIKPSDTLRNRLTHIYALKRLGFSVSSGNITCLPGQTLESLADDLLLLKRLDLPMGSTSIFIPNDRSNYARSPAGDIDVALNFTAILRIMNPAMLIPSTSSLELVARGGQYLGLMAGANTITLHDGTPREGENKYIIYATARHKPRDALFGVAKKARLTVSLYSLLRNKPENTIFYTLINKNLKYKKPAVYCEGRTYTYQGLYELTSRFCSFLRDNNLKEGQVALLALSDSIEFVVAFLSCLRSGIIAAPVDPQMNKEEWDAVLSNARPARILATESVCSKFKSRRFLKITDDGSSDYFFSLLKGRAKTAATIGIDYNNPAVILYTSGTTGQPKGAVHTYKDLFTDTFPRTVLKLTHRDRIFCWSRIYTSFGLGNSLLFPFRFGSSVILSRNTPHAGSLQRILELRPTVFCAVPSVYDFLLSHMEARRKDSRSIRLCIASGEKLYEDVFKRWELAYKKKLLECYGSTEMCHPFVSNIPGREKSGSPGKPLAGFDMRFSKSGRIYYKGPSLLKGYYRDKELTRKTLIGGWFKSDDVGYTDRQGYVFIKGRSNLVVKSGGKWISVVDIEATLRNYRLIKEIVAVKKERGLDFYVSLDKNVGSNDAERRIRKYCMRNLTMHELPKKIWLIDAIPKTESGKIDRKQLEGRREKN